VKPWVERQKSIDRKTTWVIRKAEKGSRKLAKQNGKNGEYE